jgi:hypothetical protein
MQTIATTLLSIAALLTVLSAPLVWSIGQMRGPDAAGAGIGIFLLSVVRGVVLMGALLVVAGMGRMDAWIPSRGMQTALVVGGVLLVEAVTCGMQTLALDGDVPRPFPLLFAAVGTLLPAFLAVAGFLAEPRVALQLGMGMAVAAGAGAMVFYGPVTAEARSARERGFQEERAREAERMTEWKALPADAPVEKLLPFSVRSEPWEVRNLALTRIRAVPGYREILISQREGERRLEALLLLGEELNNLPEELQAQCYAAAGEVAGDFEDRLGRGDSVPEREAGMLGRFLVDLNLGSEERRAKYAEGVEKANAVLQRMAVQQYRQPRSKP